MQKLIDLARRIGAALRPVAPTLSPSERLAATMQPNPDYRRRRLAHLSPDRVQRYFDNVAKTYAGE